MDYLKLGASLYVPAIHNDIINIAKGLKFPNLKSVIFDTEDAISEDDLPFAYHNLNKMLNALAIESLENDKSQKIINFTKPLIFIRVRNPEEYKKILKFENIEQITGFALPKFSVENMSDYLEKIIPNKKYMPILEKDIFNIRVLEKIKDFLLGYKENIISLRIGATDLLSAMNLRRNSQNTVYEIGVLNQVISNIITIFKPYGFNITGAVWESFCESSKQKLEEEVRLDLLNGLFGKSVIHPWQVDIVQDMYKVSAEDYKTALKILDPYSPAVFKMYNRMNEKTTHSNWARSIIERSNIYGITQN
ncbi:MAG: HpcH/HpaI aldolase/citrate lyase family protein [Candidatus Sericytochromatia bacterium]